MNTNIRVENHQPVPLVPLAELNYEDGEPIFLDPIVGESGATYRRTGWYAWNGLLNDFYRLDDVGEEAELCENLSGWDQLDEYKTMGRRLEPGERLVITIEG